MYRDGSVWTAHSVADVDTGQFARARYVRVDVTGLIPIEDISFGSPDCWYYYPALTTDLDSNMVMVFNRSCSDSAAQPEYAGVRFTTRLDGAELQPSEGLKSGEANYVKTYEGSRNRWGDYSGVAVDPADPSSIWMFAEYAAFPENTWETWFGQVQFAEAVPIVIINAPTTGGEGSPLTFDGSPSTGSDGSPVVGYDWDFGDGATSEGAVVAHTFGDDGPYTVTLAVTDNLGASASSTHQIIISNVAPTVTSVIADPSTVDEGMSTTITVIAIDATGDIPTLRYSFDCDGDGVFEVPPQTGGASAECMFPDGPADTVVNVRVEDKDGGVSSGSVVVPVENLPPTIVSVIAEPNAHPETGGTSTITLDATDVPADTLSYFFDCDGNEIYEIGPQGGASAICNFPAGVNTYAVNVRVDDGDGGSAADSTTVNVGVSDDQWDANISLSASSQDVQLTSGITELLFGVHPDATDAGDPALDIEIPSIPTESYILFYFHYPGNDALFQELTTSRIAPAITDRDILIWPLRIEIMLTNPVAPPEGIDINVGFNWEIDAIPLTFITALLIDNGALEVVNMGGSGLHSLTIHMAQDEIFTFRDVSLAVSKSHVQALVLRDQWNMGALTVEPVSRNVDDILSDVVGASVITWNPVNRTYVVADELIPGLGFWIKAIGDVVQLIPGDPIEENVRGQAP